jgi:hypothetical protein
MELNSLNDRDNVMFSKYIIIVLSAATAGCGVAFWRASNEIDLQTQAAQMAVMAQLAAEDEVAALKEKLMLESKEREINRQAHEKAANRAAETAQKLAEQIGATKKIEARLADAEKAIHIVNDKVANQIAARRATQAELYTAQAQVQTLAVQLQRETGYREAAETAQQKAEAAAQAATEKLALEIKAREAVSNSSQAKGVSLEPSSSQGLQRTAAKPRLYRPAVRLNVPKDTVRMRIVSAGRGYQRQASERNSSQRRQPADTARRSQWAETSR